MPDSLEQLDLLLAVAKLPRVHRDGIRFLELRYIDATLTAYVGEEALLRYDPRGVAKLRVFHEDRFLCLAVCPELASETVLLREVIRSRERHRELRQPRRSGWGRRFAPRMSTAGAWPSRTKGTRPCSPRASTTTDWYHIESAAPYACRGTFGPVEVPGSGGAFYAAKLVNSPS